VTKSTRIEARKSPSSKQIPQFEQLPRGQDGVDLTLIRWMLSLTPAQRLRALEDNVRSIMRLRAKRKRTKA
jgi:hypothetical protein